MHAGTPAKRIPLGAFWDFLTVHPAGWEVHMMNNSECPLDISCSACNRTESIL